ncbi:AAA family ATPase [Lentisphaerota bacterium WC36G]|nr:AAA family ATPase [Lentisphaerae bacterium WC36]
MRIDSVKIENYRSYKDIEFNFLKKESSHDLHVIVAQNGVGKTNLLNAIEWCLYGDEPHLGNEKESLPLANIYVFDELKNCGKESLNVKVEVIISAKGESHKIRRTRKFNIDYDLEKPELVQLEENLLVWKNIDLPNPELLKDTFADDLINVFFRKDIRRYFFFDGEQLTSYFEKARDSKNDNKIKKSIMSLSQVEILENIQKRLKSTLTDYKKEAGDQVPCIKKINTNILEREKKVERLENDINEIEISNEKADKEIEKKNVFLNDQKGVSAKIDKLNELDSKLNLEQTQRDEILKELHRFIYDSTLKIAFYKASRKSLKFIDKQDAAGKLPPAIDKGILIESLNSKNCLVCGNSLTSESKLNIEKLIETYNISSAASNMLSKLKGSLEDTINLQNFRSDKGKILDKLKQNEDKIKKYEDELNTIDATLNDYPTEESKNDIEIKLRDARNYIKAQEGLIKQNLLKLGEYNSNKVNLTKEIDCLKLELKDVMEKQNILNAVYRNIKFVEKSLKIISKIINEIMTESRNKMEKSTLDYFLKLIWKEHSYESLKLDDSYSMELFHNKGYTCLGSCSAAEKALLALSYTLSLHDLTGQNSLLFIDTPLSRVSDENRNFFASVIADISKTRQIILAFTPSEYSNEVKMKFNNIPFNKIELATNNEKETIKKEVKYV